MVGASCEPLVFSENSAAGHCGAHRAHNVSQTTLTPIESTSAGSTGTSLPPAEDSSRRFGTFGGVFTPSILTILGVIMFMRAGFVVGQAGILGALIILLVCEAIVILTGLSISAIATNTQVKGGGAYFLISRVLGPEFGGSIGLTLFLAQAISVPFYILGFTEALVNTMPSLKPWTCEIAYVTMGGLFAINYFGSAWAIKMQYFIMAVLGLAVFALLGGAVMLFDPALLEANWEPKYSSDDMSFTVVLAIFFPAVTGIMAGVNMSGDLKDPARSLVRGTFAAVVVGALIYLLEIILCGGSQTRAELIETPYEILLENALFGTWYLIAGGVFAATLSSALGSFMGAPRVLQALASDKIFSFLNVFSRTPGKSGEPRIALVLTLVISAAVIYPATREGNDDAFNIVASTVAMFFLLTYGMVNVAAFVESFGSNPSFRPRFRFFHWSTALLGAAACVGIMFLIDAKVAVLAVVIIGVLYVYVERHAAETTFGDARRGFVYTAAAKNLRRLQIMPIDPKNWRPNILILAGEPERRLTLIRYGIWFEARRGIASLVQLLSGNLSEMSLIRRTAHDSLKRFIDENDLQVFPEVVVTTNFDEGIRVIVQTHSLDPVKPNLVLVGWPRVADRILPFASYLRDLRELGKSVVTLVDRGVPDDHEREKRIDLWWRGQKNGSLMVILAHLLTQNWEWKNATIRLLRVVNDESGRQAAHDAIAKLAEAGRMDAEIDVVVSSEPFPRVLHHYSSDASVVMLGFEIPDETDARVFHERMEGLLERMPTTLLVNSSGDADLLA